MSPTDALKQYFGLDAFRPPQDAIIEAVLAGQDCLVVMPTGGGKSLCYQLPALLLPGVTIIVSPLIALMKDQVDVLRAKGLPAAAINSMQSAEEQAETLRAIRSGEVKLVYVAPERFRAPSFLRALPDQGISLFAIDEAHCLSQWGHDFRPDYMKLRAARKALGDPPCIALTATATPDVQGDIKQHLALREPSEFVAGFERPNLSFRVVQVNGEDAKFARLEALIEEHKTGIVYCATRKSVDAVAERLELAHSRVIRYHGGLSDRDRSAAQDMFMSKGADVVVATNAFGMGIDRADIRFVCHFEMPGSVEAYYQEGGRAGRDGKPGVCELLFTFADKRIQEFFIEGANPGLPLIEEVFEQLCAERDAENIVKLPVDDLIDRTKRRINPMAVSSALSLLNRAGLIERFDLPGRRLKGTRVLKPELLGRALPFDAAALAEKRRRDDERLQSVIRFAYANKCRQDWILHYFGEQAKGPCGRCDHCVGADEASTRLGTREETTILIKALSGVARCCRRIDQDHWQARFGKRKIIQALMGSEAEDLKRAGLHKISTFGLLRKEGTQYLNQLFDALATAGLVETVEKDGFALLQLSVLGSEVMRGAETARLEWPERPKVQSVKSHATSNSGRPPRSGVDGSADCTDPVLYQALATKRNELAAAAGAPAYTIFPNKVLVQLADQKPLSVGAAAGIKGIGPAKIRTILPIFLDIIQFHVKSR